MKFDSEAARRKRHGVEATGLSKRREDPNKGLEWVEIPPDKIEQADLPNLIAAWNEFCLRLWGMRPYVDPKEADTQRWIDACAMKLTCRRLAEHAEKELGDGTALLRISGLLPAVQPTANEWDAGWEVVRRLEMRHSTQNGRSADSEGEDPRFVSVDIRKGTIAVDGTAYPAESHHCTAVKALIDEEGRNLTGPQLCGLSGCLGKKWDREFKNLKGKIPALADRITSDGNKGYRILNF